MNLDGASAQTLTLTSMVIAEMTLGPAVHAGVVDDQDGDFKDI